MDCHITDVQVLFFVKNNLKKTGSSYLSSFLLNVSKLICMKKYGLYDDFGIIVWSNAFCKSFFIGMKFPKLDKLMLIVHFFPVSRWKSIRKYPIKKLFTILLLYFFSFLIYSLAASLAAVVINCLELTMMPSRMKRSFIMGKAKGFSVSSTKAAFYQLNGAFLGWSPIAVKRLTGNLPALLSIIMSGWLWRVFFGVYQICIGKLKHFQRKILSFVNRQVM